MGDVKNRIREPGMRGTAECVADVATTFWRDLFVAQNHGNIESNCLNM